MKKGDLVSFEYLTTHQSGVGWELVRGFGVIASCDNENDLFSIVTRSGTLLERTNLQIDLINSSEEFQTESVK